MGFFSEGHDGWRAAGRPHDRSKRSGTMTIDDEPSGRRGRWFLVDLYRAGASFWEPRHVSGRLKCVCMGYGCVMRPLTPLRRPCPRVAVWPVALSHPPPAASNFARGYTRSVERFTGQQVGSSNFARAVWVVQRISGVVLANQELQFYVKKTTFKVFLLLF
jgi:hypothetical protein